MPKLEQDGARDCAPTAAVSLVKWFQQNGFPNIETRGGSSAIADIKTQLQTDTKTDDRGSWSDRLRDAMNRMINEGPNNQPGAYKKQPRAEFPGSKTAYKDFGFIDQEFAKGEGILLLFDYGENQAQNHWVHVNNWTGSGTTRALEYMDPATGNYETLTVTDAGDNRTFTYDQKAGRIGGIIAMSPANSTEGTFEAVDPNDPSKGTKITYTPYFPATRKMKDLHIRTRDCNQDNWSVSGLPAGWVRDPANPAERLARREGLEPPTLRFEGRKKRQK